MSRVIPAVGVAIAAAVVIGAVVWSRLPAESDRPMGHASVDVRYGQARADARRLVVVPRRPASDFARSRFGEPWSDDVDVEFGHNGCNTRDDVLRRDLTDLRVRPGTCFAESGTLRDPYRQETIAFRRVPITSETVQIDHVVALSDAWYKGAAEWDDRRRRDFANDPRNLLAVGGAANFDKASRDAASWLPPNAAFRCEFVARQVAVKTAYRLGVSAKEKRAMERVLADC